MSNNKKENFVSDITNMEEDFSQWYTDVILKTEMVDYAPVKGFMVIRPYGFAMWENIQGFLDRRFKETGHKNAYFPLLIPESMLNKEKEHVEGFAPEVAWVTRGGDNELGEKLCVRPTSETIICTMYSKWLNTYRQLPFLYNQWCSVVRWEKTTRPFLRTSEFLWQEGHTLHETPQQAEEETLRMLGIYVEMINDLLAIPVLVGKKTEKEKFAGASATYTMESMMKDGKALQSGTSHNLGQQFAKAFDIKYQDRNENISLPYSTSWGVSTRLIGAIVMVHGDNRGLVLPPRVAPVQAVVIPVRQEKDGVNEKAHEIYNGLINAGVRAEIDDDVNNSPGWKFNEYEMKGYPVRIEIGPRDIENGVCMVFRRDTLEKEQVSLSEINEYIPKLLDEIHENMYNKAKENLYSRIFVATDYKQIEEVITNDKGFVKAMWCGDEACENKLKEDFAATIRCIPFEEAQEKLSDVCPICGKPADKMVYIGKSY